MRVDRREKENKSENDAEFFGINVPSTQPSFMVPEIVVRSIMAVASMFAALGLYAHKKKQHKNNENTLKFLIKNIKKPKP